MRIENWAIFPYHGITVVAGLVFNGVRTADDRVLDAGPQQMDVTHVRRDDSGKWIVTDDRGGVHSLGEPLAPEALLVAEKIYLDDRMRRV